MNKSENIDKLAQALAEVQQEMQPVIFDAVNPYYKSKYATLGAMIDEIKRTAPAKGISFIQLPVSEGYQMGVETVIMHNSGQWISEKFLLPLDVDSKNPIQEGGKGITYARRYGLASVFGMYAEEDTDAEKRQQQDVTNKEQPVKESKLNSETKTVEKIDKSQRPYSAVDLKKALIIMAGKEDTQPALNRDYGKLAAIIGSQVDTEEERHQLQDYLFGSETIKEVSPEMVTSALKWLDAQYDTQTKTYAISTTAIKELNNVKAAIGIGVR